MLSEEQRNKYAPIIARIKEIDVGNHMVNYYLGELDKLLKRSIKGFGGKELRQDLETHPTTSLSRFVRWIDQRDDDRLRKGMRGKFSGKYAANEVRRKHNLDVGIMNDRGRDS